MSHDNQLGLAQLATLGHYQSGGQGSGSILAKRKDLLFLFHSGLFVSFFVPLMDYQLQLIPIVGLISR